MKLNVKKEYAQRDVKEARQVFRLAGSREIMTYYYQGRKASLNRTGGISRKDQTKPLEV